MTLCLKGLQISMSCDEVCDGLYLIIFTGTYYEFLVEKPVALYNKASL